MRDDRTHPGARWCEQHQRWECTKRRKNGDHCHGVAVRGLNVCRMHGGKTGEVLKAEGEAAMAITAWSAVCGEPTVSHTEAVLAMLQMAWLRAHFYASLLERQVHGGAESDSGGSNSPDPSDCPGDDTNGSEPATSLRSPAAGLIGYTYGAVKDIGIYASGEAIRGLAQLEAAERDRVVRYAKTASDMKVDDAVIDVIQRQADQVQTLLAGVIGRLGYDWNDPRVVDAIDAALHELDDQAA